MRILGTEPLSVILIKTVDKVEKAMPIKCPKKLKLKWMMQSTYRITMSINFNTESLDALKLYKLTEVDRRTWLHVPSGTLLPTSSDTHQVVEK